MRSLKKLHVYSLSRDLAVQVYRLTKVAPLSGEFALADQIRRAVTSVPGNIAEAYALGTRPQLVRGLRIALGSAVELETHLWVAERVGCLPQQHALDHIRRDLDRVIGMLVGLLKRYGARVGA